ncbi:hypothetical protein C8A01DRAFT_19862 [Parachaetomium inaequale]|uniref:Uncharacterized protein n=1 Tax=Parachaetomium inaequale TaxID=2588326 RepID=A0AAN6P7K3_9PEZI|nr:hypothetical protein C8A01DRAFT_19862 [Parachaetomium inaequale]
MAGRSGFFTTPDLPRSIEVRIPRMSHRIRAEYDRLSDVSGHRSASQRSGTPGSASVASKGMKRKTKRRTIHKSLNDLNLGRFRYNGRGPSTAAASVTKNETGRGRHSKTVVHTGRVTKKAASTATGKKPRARVGKDEKARARSAFARAVEHQQRRRAGNV